MNVWWRSFFYFVMLDYSPHHWRRQIDITKTSYHLASGSNDWLEEFQNRAITVFLVVFSTTA
jgi:hypothetical protein